MLRRKLNSNRLRLSTTIVTVICLFISTTFSSQAEKIWSYSNNRFSSDEVNLDIPDQFNKINGENDLGIQLQSSSPKMLLAIITALVPGIQTEDIKDSIDKNSPEDSAYIANLWGLDSEDTPCTSTLISSRIKKTSGIDIVEYSFNVSYLNSNLVAYNYYLHCPDSDKIIRLHFIGEKSGDDYFDQIIKSATLTNPNTDSSPATTEPQKKDKSPEIIEESTSEPSNEVKEESPSETTKETSSKTPTETVSTESQNPDRYIQIRSQDNEVNVKKKLTLQAIVIRTDESSPKSTDLIWESQDGTIATVSPQGIVTGVSSGTALINCYAKDDPSIKASISITVKTPVTSLKAKKTKIVLSTLMSARDVVDVLPADADNKLLTCASSNDSIVMCRSSEGLFAPVGVGDCYVTFTTTDGSNKSIRIPVHVPPFTVDKTEYVVTSKEGITIPINDTRVGTLEIVGRSPYFSAIWMNGDIFIDPIKAGTGTITVRMLKWAKDAVKLKIKITEDAVYKPAEFPPINYSNALRYPENYLGDRVSFTGRIIQVIDKNTYLIGSNGKWGNAVYVTIPTAFLKIPLIEDDLVIIYGNYYRNKQYTTVLGGTATVPRVNTLKVTLKEKK